MDEKVEWKTSTGILKYSSHGHLDWKMSETHEKISKTSSIFAKTLFLALWNGKIQRPKKSLMTMSQLVQGYSRKVRYGKSMWFYLFFYSAPSMEMVDYRRRFIMNQQLNHTSYHLHPHIRDISSEILLMLKYYLLFESDWFSNQMMSHLCISFSEQFSTKLYSQTIQSIISVNFTHFNVGWNKWTIVSTVTSLIIASLHSRRTKVGGNDDECNRVTICTAITCLDQTDHLSALLIWLWTVGSISRSIYEMAETRLCLFWFIGTYSQNSTRRRYRQNTGEISHSEETTTRFINQDGIATDNDISDCIHVNSGTRLLDSCFSVFPLYKALPARWSEYFLHMIRW